MNEPIIQTAVFEWCAKSDYRFVVPNFSHYGAGECDLLGLEKGRLLTEFEIKISVSDFKHDAVKPKHKYYEALRAKAGYFPKGMPSRFYFVTTKAVAEKVASIMPAWAGLMVYEKQPGRYGDPADISVSKPAPRLHEEKASLNTITRMARTMMWRFWTTRKNLEAARERLKGCKCNPLESQAPSARE